MAKAQGLVLLRGKIHNVIFRVREGRKIVHMAPKEIKVRNATELYYGNRREFGGAAKMGADIYNGLQWGSRDKELGPIFRGYTQNYLTGRIRKAPLKTKVHVVGRAMPYLEEFRFHHVAKALLGCNLSKDTAPAHLVHMTPMGPMHNPTAIKITGLEAAARAVPVLGNARLEFRIHLRQTEICDVHFHPVRKKWEEAERTSPDGRTHRHGRQMNWCTPSDWIPTEIIPKEGITLQIPTTLQSSDHTPSCNHLTAIMIEWREIRNVGRRTIQHHDHGIVKIAALHAPIEAWNDQPKKASPENPSRGSNSNSNSEAKHHLTPKPANLQPKINWKTDPKTYLQAALAKISPEIGPPKPAT